MEVFWVFVIALGFVVAVAAIAYKIAERQKVDYST
jgi:hypothetical protein